MSGSSSRVDSCGTEHNVRIKQDDRVGPGDGGGQAYRLGWDLLVRWSACPIFQSARRDTAGPEI